jgi:hypothetical protein
MRRALAFLLVVVALPVAGHARRRPRESLVSVASPANRSTASAHPWVNVIVSLSSNADPATFRAHFGRKEVTSLFQPDPVKGPKALRAELPANMVRLGRRFNQLRMSVRAKKTGRAKPKRDIDRLRFRAVETPDRRPIAQIVPGSEVLLPGVATKFIGDGSSDPDGDALTYHWDFGDGRPSDEPDPVHTFDASTEDRVIALTVSDGILSSTYRTTLLLLPKICAGCTPGVLRVNGDPSIEFGGVAPGTSQTMPIQIANPDATSTSQLAVALGIDGGPFSITPTQFSLGPGESTTVNVTFTPDGPGHRQANITAVAAASNQQVIHLLAHGFGGSAPGSGPTLAASTLYYQDTRGNVRGVTPAGQRFAIDNTVGSCVSSNGTGTRDPCTASTDCAVAGEMCQPGLTQSLDPVDMCTNGLGHLYLLSDDVFTDPNANDLTEISVGVLDLKLDPTGVRQSADFLRKTTTQTGQITCDHTPAGNVYLAEYHDLSDSNCFREAQENLVAINTATGVETTLLRQLDGVEGFDACQDDIDESDDLEVVTTPADGLTRLYSSFTGDATTGGVYQALTLGNGAATEKVIPFSPDITGFFQLLPDGSVLYAASADPDHGAKGLLSVYRIAPSQVTLGPVGLAALTPCAVVEVQNNLGTTLVDQDNGSFVVGPEQGSSSPLLLLSFYTTGGTNMLPPSNVFPETGTQRTLGLRGTYAIEIPADPTAACNVLGLVNVEYMNSMRF